MLQSGEMQGISGSTGLFKCYGEITGMRSGSVEWASSPVSPNSRIFYVWVMLTVVRISNCFFLDVSVRLSIYRPHRSRRNASSVCRASYMSWWWLDLYNVGHPLIHWCFSNWAAVGLSFGSNCITAARNEANCLVSLFPSSGFIHLMTSSGVVSCNSFIRIRVPHELRQWAWEHTIRIEIQGCSFTSLKHVNRETFCLC